MEEIVRMTRRLLPGNIFSLKVMVKYNQLAVKVFRPDDLPALGDESWI